MNLIHAVEPSEHFFKDFQSGRQDDRESHQQEADTAQKR
jgi:hypothetical protein